MFPRKIEDKLRTTIQFYTNLKMKRAKKRIDNNQMPLFELTEAEKISYLKELTKTAVAMNKYTWESLNKHLKLENVRDTVNKEWVKSLFKIVDKNIEFEKLQQIRIDRVSEQLSKWNIKIVDNGKLNKTQLKALKND